MTGASLSGGQAAFFAAATFVYLTLLAHAILVRGPRIGLGFFVYAGVLAFARDLFFISPLKGRPPYEFLVSLRVLGVPPLAFLGWTITAYLAWCVTEALLVPWPRTSERLFVMLGCSYVVGAIVSFAVEPTGVSLGLWRWVRFEPSSVSGLWSVLSTYSVIASWWAVFTVQILGSYWFFECSEHRRSPLRFLAIAFLLGPRALKFLGRSRYAWFYPLAVIALAIGVRTRLDWPVRPREFRLAYAIPMGVGFVMAAALAAIDLVASGRSDLAASKAPLVLALGVAISMSLARRRVSSRPALAGARAWTSS